MAFEGHSAGQWLKLLSVFLPTSSSLIFAFLHENPTAAASKLTHESTIHPSFVEINPVSLVTVGSNQ